MPGILAPNVGQGHIRDPRDPNIMKGKNVNPPRYPEIGGLSGPGKWNKETGHPQAAQTNVAKVEAPVRGSGKTRSARGRSDD